MSFWVKRGLSSIGIWLLIAVVGFAIADVSGGGKDLGAMFSLLGFLAALVFFIIPLFRRKSSVL